MVDKPNTFVRVVSGADYTATKGENVIYGYSLVTDGVNNGRIRVYQDSKVAANQKWDDTTIGPDNGKTGNFSDQGASIPDTMIVEVSGTGAIAYIGVTI